MENIDDIRQELHSIFQQKTGRDITSESIPNYEVPEKSDMSRLLLEEVRKIGNLTNPNQAQHKPEIIPRIEIRETKSELILSVELPGINKEQLNLEVKDGNLLISAPKELIAVEGQTLGYSEIAYGTVNRIVKLPTNISMKGLKASYVNGIVEVRMEKEKEVNQPTTKIKIQ